MRVLRTRGLRVGPSAVLLAVLLAGACTKETIVFRDREPFNPPPDELSGFLGYFTVETQQTTCGNCHVGIQRDWKTSRHAHAWATLQDAAGAQASCYTCHTVNERGNVAVGPAGWNAVQHEAYRDVQCESCHGPGLAHVMEPDLVSAHETVRARVGVTAAPGASCVACHSDEAPHPFAAEWEQSGHAVVRASPAGNPNCAFCHEGKAALTSFGVRPRFVEAGSADHIAITCAVCHDPHGSPFEGQLRASISTPSRENLCVTCHSRTATPWTFRGPHGAQGLLVIGQSTGWIPPGFVYDTTQIASSHGSTANPRLCATCHVASTTVIDPGTGGTVFESTGHLFEAIPCLDDQGIPTSGPCTLEQRDFQSCATAGCHGTEAVARTAYQFIIEDLNSRLDQIWTDLNDNCVIDATDGGLLPQLVANAASAADSAQLDVSTSLVSVAKGTLWNAMLASTSSRPCFRGGQLLGRNFSAHPSGGNGVHNPFLLRALLIASIQAMMDTYSLMVPPGAALEMTGPVPPGVKIREDASRVPIQAHRSSLY